MKVLRNIALTLFATSAFLASGSAAMAKPAKPRTNGGIEQQSSRPAISTKVKLLLERAQAGDATAQNELGVCYLQGNGVAKNDTLAYKWFTKSAVQKNDRAMVNMVFCLSHGVGVEKDFSKARELFVNIIARDNDTIVSMLNNSSKKDIFLSRAFAYAYEGGKGVKRNPAAVKTYLKQAIELGDKSAYYPYAQYCLRTRDHVSACNAYRLAYEAGEEKAAYWYGRYLITGEGGVENPMLGLKLVYPFAQQGNTGAMFLVGQCLLTGNGIMQDAESAVEWLQKAAANGSTEAMWQLALCNARGEGVERNFLNAFRLMSREAMHSSEHHFREWLDPDKGGAAELPQYTLFLQGLRALNDDNFSVAQKIAKELSKNKVEKESKLLEAFVLLSSSNSKRNPKKAFKLIAPYIESDPLLLYVVDRLQLDPSFSGINEADRRNVPADLERLGSQGFGPAYAILGILYADGREGLEQSDSRTIGCWLRAEALCGLTVETAEVLAKCYEEGLGGLKPDKEKARKLRNFYREDKLQTVLEMIPEWSGK